MQIPNHQFYNCVVVSEDGTESLVNAQWLYNTNNNFWPGWMCNAGVDKISIMPDGSVYSGECHNDFLGNIDTGWQLLSSPTECKRNRCTSSTDDLIVSKEYKNVV